MNICKSISQLQSNLNNNPVRVLVPTMGALHMGHCSLIEKAREIAGCEGLVIVSIFVNPTQFDRVEDLDSYPNTLDADLKLCQQFGADLVFAPPASDMYHGDRSISLTEKSLSQTLCGATRPGHFDGVCLVVNKLFNVTQATDAIFGEKDFQQLAIIKRMVRDLNINVKIHPGATIRESTGLAMSSRNLNLTDFDRRLAPQVYQQLTKAATMARSGETSSSAIIDSVTAVLTTLENSPRIDYLEVVDENTLQPLEDLSNGTPVMAIAIFFGEVRLIDHIHLH